MPLELGKFVLSATLWERWVVVKKVGVPHLCSWEMCWNSTLELQMHFSTEMFLHILVRNTNTGTVD